MKLPIIVSEHGDISVYESVRDAEMNLEAIDVDNNEYIVYDSNGCLLSLEVVSKTLGPKLVKISDSENAPLDKVSLRKGLENFLSNCENMTTEQLSNLSDDELLGKVKKWAS